MVVDENQAIPPVYVIRGTNPDSAIPSRPPENVTEQAEGLIEVLHGTWVSNRVRDVAGFVSRHHSGIRARPHAGIQGKDAVLGAEGEGTIVPT
jgi:hypothetical protein